MKCVYLLMQDGLYKRIGVLVGMSLVQGGSGYPFFAPAVYDYLTGKDVCSISPGINEIPDFDVINCIEKVLSMSIILCLCKYL